MLEMIVRPNSESAKYSTAEKDNANLATCGATKISTKALKIPPKVEAFSAASNA